MDTEAEVKQGGTLSEQVQKEMLARMRRIEGQARGVQRMIAEDRDCLEILTQLASLRSAAYSASVAMTQNFAVQCLRNGDEQASADEAVRSLVDVLLRAPH
jgi:DNA-binding FrmR family transcriptional regulator